RINKEGTIINVVRKGNDLEFGVESWPSILNTIHAGSYTLKEPLLVEEYIYESAYTLPELYLSNTQRQLLKMLSEVVEHVELELDSNELTQNSKIITFNLSNGHKLHWRKNALLYENEDDVVEEIQMKELEEKIFEVFKKLTEIIKS